MNNHLILIGYMGCGKTTLGKKLAFRERLPLLDTDQWIEEKQGKEIAAIFDGEGEAAFRQMETDCLKEIKKLSGRRVISVGGGLPLKEENRRLLKELGTVVYLRARPETIYERLKNDTTRPLLRGDDPQGKIRAMLGTRGPIYEEAADVIVDVDDKPYEAIIGEIRRAGRLCGGRAANKRKERTRRTS